MEYKPFLLFIFLLTITGFAFYFIEFIAPTLLSNPLWGLIILLTVGAVLYIAFQLIMGMKSNNKAKAKISAVMMIAIVAVAGFGFVAFAYWQNILGFGDTINDMINPPACGTMLTVNYKDGSSETYSSKDNSFDQLKIIDTANSKEVVSINTGIFITPSWTSDAQLTSYDVSGTVQMKIKVAASGGATVYDTGAVNIQNNLHPTLTSGSSATITSMTMTAAQFESIVPTTTAQYSLEYSNPTPVTVTLHFDNGDAVSKTVTAPTMSWIFQRIPNTGTSSFTGLSVSFFIGRTTA